MESLKLKYFILPLYLIKLSCGIYFWYYQVFCPGRLILINQSQKLQWYTKSGNLSQPARFLKTDCWKLYFKLIAVRYYTLHVALCLIKSNNLLHFLQWLSMFFLFLFTLNRILFYIVAQKVVSRRQSNLLSLQLCTNLLWTTLFFFLAKCQGLVIVWWPCAVTDEVIVCLKSLSWPCNIWCLKDKFTFIEKLSMHL